MAKRTWLGPDKLARIKRLFDGGYNTQEIADRMRLSRSTVCCVIRRRFQQRQSGPRPAPADFGLFGAVETCTQLQERYGACLRTIRRWCAEKRIERPDMHYRRPLRARPDNFEALAPTLSIKEMRSLWGASYHTVVRWCGEIGLATPRAKPEPVQPAPQMIGWADRYYAEVRLAA